MLANVISFAFQMALGYLGAQSEPLLMKTVGNEVQQRRLEALKKRLEALPNPAVLARKADLLMLSMAIVDMEDSKTAVREFAEKTDADSLLLAKQSQKNLEDAEKRYSSYRKAIAIDPSLLTDAQKVAVESRRLIAEAQARGWDHYFKPETTKAISKGINDYIDKIVMTTSENHTTKDGK